MKALCPHCKVVVHADKICSNCYNQLISTEQKQVKREIRPSCYKDFKPNNFKTSDDQWLNWVKSRYPEFHDNCRANIESIKKCD